MRFKHVLCNVFLIYRYIYVRKILKILKTIYIYLKSEFIEKLKMKSLILIIAVFCIGLSNCQEKTNKGFITDFLMGLNWFFSKII